MSRTRTDLIVKVADLLGITQTGQELSAEDAGKIDGVIDEVVGMLTQTRVSTIDPTAVDVSVFDPFARLIANRVGADFGVEFNADVEARDTEALRIMQSQFARRRYGAGFAGDRAAAQ